MQAPPGSTQIPQLALQQSMPLLQIVEPHVSSVGQGKNSQLSSGLRLTKDPSLHFLTSLVHQFTFGQGKNSQALLGSRSTKEPSLHFLTSWEHALEVHGLEGCMSRFIQTLSGGSVGPLFPSTHSPLLQQVHPERPHSILGGRGFLQHLTGGSSGFSQRTNFGHPRHFFQ